MLLLGNRWQHQLLLLQCQSLSAWRSYCLQQISVISNKGKTRCKVVEIPVSVVGDNHLIQPTFYMHMTQLSLIDIIEKSDTTLEHVLLCWISAIDSKTVFTFLLSWSWRFLGIFYMLMLINQMISKQVITEHHYRKSYHKHPLQHISNSMCKWCNSFQSIGCELQFSAKKVR